MDTTTQANVLVVANRTAATPRLMDEISRRRKRGPCRFTLLIPDAESRRRGDWTLETALPLLRRAAAGPVEGVVCGTDPFTSIRDTVAGGAYDEIIVSTLPRRTSIWLRRDLVRRVRGLGLPVTAVVPRQVRVDPDMTDSSAFRAGIIMGG